MTQRLHVGLLGGSFNPAHDGHLHISQEALKRLKLDQVWWLVSPQNPLKPKKDMASFSDRCISAEMVTRKHRNIRVSDFEKRHDLQYTFATLAALTKRYPHISFVWIMGGDNLAGFHKWQRWRSIIQIMPIVVFDRVPFSHTALRTKAAISMHRSRLPERNVSAISSKKKHWAYMYILSRRHPASSTEIRNNLKLDRI